ncbi:hypothetical protein VTN00DRAFT_2600 [Thermoascus crustaceus]|uniref:uncharacterized protein n=1 Tax=Thermoascus crustaceus TaxID=5088 RepID=UPI003742E543
MSTPASASGFEPHSGSIDVSGPVERTLEVQRPARPVNGSTAREPPTVDPSNYPGGKKSLSGISIRAFLLGVTLATCLCITVFTLTAFPTSLWRVPFFIASLCVFHFLEYYVTARYNTLHANISAFLLSSNGWQYNFAHGSAIAECILFRLFFPDSYFKWTAAAFGGVKVQVALGLVLMAVGQTVRTLAMAHAGSNFNHTVQVERKEGHMLVKTGVYSVLRHPSYFGFFWWGLGTQLVLGNVICFLGYTFVLWMFFSRRIQREERFLILFFGDEYVDYRRKTWVGIPGIR